MKFCRLVEIPLAMISYSKKVTRSRSKFMPIPIPTRPPGYAIGKAGAPLQIEMFLDIQCPFSKKAWPTMLEVAKHYGEFLHLTLYPMTLPNHRQSWDATKAAVAFADDNPEKFIQFFSDLYDRQAQLSNDAFRDKTHRDLYELLSQFAVDCGDWEAEQFKQKLQSEAVYNATKVPLRIAFTRSVWSTPTFFINGAEAMQLSSSSTVQDWQKILDEL
jgi:protein-disulfide isomerase